MGHWLEQDGSGRWVEQPNGVETYTLRFEADAGAGLDEATTRGFTRFSTALVRGRLMRLTQRVANPGPPTRELVELVYETPSLRGGQPEKSEPGKTE